MRAPWGPVRRGEANFLARTAPDETCLTSPSCWIVANLTKTDQRPELAELCLQPFFTTIPASYAGALLLQQRHDS